MDKKIGGAALPHGVMMLCGKNVGLGVLDEFDMLHAASFQIPEVRTKIPFLRGALSLGTSATASLRALWEMYHIRWEAADSKNEDLLRMGTYLGTAMVGALSGELLSAKVGEKIKDKGHPRLGAAAEEWVSFLTSCGLIGLLALTPAGREVRGFHGAEHKTVSAYDAGQSPIPENARHQSRVHPRCGTSLTVVSNGLYMALATLLLPLLPEKARETARCGLLTLCTLLAYEIMMGAIDKNRKNSLLRLGALAQKFTTAEPRDEMLEAASVAAQEALLPSGRY